MADTTNNAQNNTFDYDYIVVGSGFGGAVSALRLTEKGYRVAVIEAGKRYRSEDFPRTNMNVRKFLWMPKLGMYGIMRMTLMRGGLILSGAGVGGGSLVYANTLLVPPKKVFRPEVFGAPDGEDVFAAYEPHFETAKRMLGVTPSPLVTPADRLLRDTAEEFGMADTYHTPTVGVYFGKPGEKVADPYFGGEGPERAGCNFCGGCMVGCQIGAKNTLDKNYLYFAEKYGAQVFPETTVVDIEELQGGGYALTTVSTTAKIFKKKRRFTARGVVLSGGVLGTMQLLLSARERGRLPRISNRLGDFIRTNSEAIIGVTDPKINHSGGISITSGVYPDPDTHIEVVRYPEGSDAIAPLATVLTDGGPGMPRPLRYLVNILRSPGSFLRTLNPFGFAKRSIILLVMQTIDNHMRMTLRRRWWWPFSRSIDTESAPGQSNPPSYIPIANDFAKKMAQRTGGMAQSSINEVLLDVGTTAHILGGAPIGRDKERGVVDRYNRVYGYENLYVIDGSMIPSNLGVNPSLTITALAEHAMSHIPAKEGAEARRHIGVTPPEKPLEQPAAGSIPVESVTVGRRS